MGLRPTPPCSAAASHPVPSGGSAPRRRTAPVGLRPHAPLAAASRRMPCIRTGSGSLPGARQRVACSTAREGACRVVPAGDRRQDLGARCNAAVGRRPRGVEPGGPLDPTRDKGLRLKLPSPRTGSGSLPGAHQGVACSTAREGACRVVPAGDRRQDLGAPCNGAVWPPTPRSRARRAPGPDAGQGPEAQAPQPPNGLRLASGRTPRVACSTAREGACRVVPAGDRRQDPGAQCIAAVCRRPRGVEPGGPPDPPPDKSPRLKHPTPAPGTRPRTRT